MMMYISVTKVKEIISGVLGPVMKQAKTESDFTRRMKASVEDVSLKCSDM
jgi:hypothetical protein